MAKLGRPKKKELFTVRLDVGGKTFESVGETIADCLKRLNTGFVKSSCYLTIERGEKKLVRLITPMHVRKLKVNKLYPVLFAKQIETAFA